jgi:hypothetical protein
VRAPLVELANERILGRAASFSIIAIAATFAPSTCSAVASGAFHEESKGLEAHALSMPTAKTPANNLSEIIAISFRYAGAR